jgi:hypothetical protein
VATTRNRKSTASVQPRFAIDEDAIDRAAGYLLTWIQQRKEDVIPEWGSSDRAAYMDEFIRGESILAGALSTMVSKVVSLDFKVVGGRNRAAAGHELVSLANDGMGWDSFISMYAQDYWATDLGGVAELGYGNDSYTGAVKGIYNLDSHRCTWVKNHIIYNPVEAPGRSVKLKPEQFMRIVDMPSPREAHFGLGYCAASRAMMSARVLWMLHRYEQERLSDLPPQGIVTASGITMPELEEAMQLFKNKELSKNNLIFKGVLWLASTMSPQSNVDVKIVPFSTLPEHFDRRDLVSTYIATLALDFGVDVREFWPMSAGPLGSATEAQVQAEKAKGKGFGRAISSIERAISWNLLPEGVDFSFDNTDSEGDLLAEQIRATKINNVRALWTPATFDAMGQPYAIITRDEARRLLVELEALPSWVSLSDTDVVLHSTSTGDTGPQPDAADVASTAAATTLLENKALQEATQKAQLGPGEPYVSINKSGRVDVLWSTRTYSIPSPNISARKEMVWRPTEVVYP